MGSDDYFGYAVAVGENVVAVGAFGVDIEENGQNYGMQERYFSLR